MLVGHVYINKIYDIFVRKDNSDEPKVFWRWFLTASALLVPTLLLLMNWGVHFYITMYFPVTHSVYILADIATIAFWQAEFRNGSDLSKNRLQKKFERIYQAFLSLVHIMAIVVTWCIIVDLNVRVVSCLGIMTMVVKFIVIADCRKTPEMEQIV